ncbi:MAG TPA: hypothetical protein VFM93_10035 [Candidatus Limnocylindria bacterium]|nr:hypothetical protein [Candidatus Limnocylindria bacterium]
MNAPRPRGAFLYPGVILLAAGLSDVSPDVKAIVGCAIPIVVIAAGAILLLRGGARRPEPDTRT